MPVAIENVPIISKIPIPSLSICYNDEETTPCVKGIGT